MEPASNTSQARPRRLAMAFGVILILLAIPLAIGGVRLIRLDGSWYYLICALVLATSGYFYLKQRQIGAVLFALLFAGTVVWALQEVGLRFWPLVPRLSGLAVLAIPALLLVPTLTGSRSRTTWFIAAGVWVVCLLAVGVALFFPHDVIRNAIPTDAMASTQSEAQQPSDWTHYGRSQAGTRFAPFEQISKHNVKDLKVAWTFKTGESTGNGSEDQNTPLQVGDSVYICTPLNQVFALNADTGEQHWHFDPKARNEKTWNRCRGVSFYDPAAGSPTDIVSGQPHSPANDPSGSCGARIITSTVDARLIALDAKTGKPCEDFGDHGTVRLSTNMGEIKPVFYVPTSAPTIVKGLILVGGWVNDNAEVGEPSGVVRAFSAKTGELVWAWDLGNPATTRLPPPGQTYTRGTPNVWSTPAADEKLGLVYLPTGNSTPDYWGAHRSPASEKYGSSIVALDINTGRERWAYQTVHHDLWDYDVPAQPALYDIPDGKGGTIPALVQVTKTANIFMLDRRTGTPLTEVQERPVPQRNSEGDQTAPTQPFSVGMPYIGPRRLEEADMWGATLFDQLSCRIAFKSMRYDGPFTPPGTDETLEFPGNFGGMNWGSASINEDTGTLIVNDIRIPLRVRLIPRAQAEALGPARPHSEFSLQQGTPYGVKNESFMSPLGIPCQAPPYGTITAIDLKSRTIAWQVPAGSIRDTKLGGLKATLPVPLGLPTIGGPMTTRSGIVFFAGTQDYYLRALDKDTGAELWKGRLPVGSQGTPISYVSPKTAKQYVVISAGGARSSPDHGDYVIAYALPDK